MLIKRPERNSDPVIFKSVMKHKYTKQNKKKKKKKNKCMHTSVFMLILQPVYGKELAVVSTIE